MEFSKIENIVYKKEDPIHLKKLLSDVDIYLPNINGKPFIVDFFITCAVDENYEYLSILMECVDKERLLLLIEGYPRNINEIEPEPNQLYDLAIGESRLKVADELKKNFKIESKFEFTLERFLDLSEESMTYLIQNHMDFITQNGIKEILEERMKRYQKFIDMMGDLPPDF